MKEETLHEALKEAVRFIKAARRLQKARTLPLSTAYNNPVEQGACRRASMDLTRKLADLRNNR